MGRFPAVVLCLVTIAVLIVAADILFFRHHFWPRLAANVGIVLLVGAFYFRLRSHL